MSCATSLHSEEERVRRARAHLRRRTAFTPAVPANSMASCDAAHREFDRLANGEIQAGTLPERLHVQGRVAWFVHQGPYSGISRAFPAFMGNVQAKFPGKICGPPGDVYVCSPDEHTGAQERSLTTIFWVPIA
jgi:hypothetical protein